MSNNSDNIEERLIPYLEDVLNPSEKQEVNQALKRDPELARELEELKETITDLREAFASGVTPPQESLSPAEVVELASHEGGLDGMPGTSQQKTRLFMSDQALGEYHMLRALSEEMRRTTLPYEEVPSIPDALMSEFQALGKPTAPKVVEISSKLSFWKRTSGWLDRIDPKPLMATAAAFAMLSLGVHFYGQSQETTHSPAVAVVSDEDVAFGSTKNRPNSNIAPEVADEDGLDAVGEKTAPTQPGPSGVAVCTSGDKALLNEQAEKLLAKKVRYTVTEDRILVAEKEVAQAREVLWGEEAAGAVAMAEKKEDTLRPKSEPTASKPETDDYESVARPERPAALRERVSAPPAPPRAARAEPTAKAAPVQNYNFRPAAKKQKLEQEAGDTGPTSRSSGKASNKRKGSSGTLSTYGDTAPDDSSLSEDRNTQSALKRKSGRSQSEVKGGLAEPRSVQAEGSASAGGGLRDNEKPSASRMKDVIVSSDERRQQRLRELALGEESEEEDERQDKSAVELKESEPIPVRQQVNRARVAPPAPTQTLQAPVANVLTSDLAVREGDIAQPTEDLGGSVAQSGRKKTDVSADQDAFRDEDGPASDIRLNSKTRASRTESKPGSINSKGARPASGASNVAYSAKPKEPAKVSETDGDLRAVAIRRNQTTVARRYNVVLSIESKGSVVKVYVRPKTELKKAELDQLRRDIRKDLGLSPEDSIIFR